MTAKALALEVIERQKQAYPLAECTLDYDHAWQLLVEVRLAAQCTDARVNVVVKDLFAKYPGVKELADAEPEDIEAIVKPCGLGRSKARDISLCMRKLRDEYGCKVPDDFDALLSLPGVGRKSANLIMGRRVRQARHRHRHPLHPAVQPHRPCERTKRTPKRWRWPLWKIIPPEEGSDLCHRFVLHGRAVCDARRPDCAACCLRDTARRAKPPQRLDNLFPRRYTLPRT